MHHARILWLTSPCLGTALPGGKSVLTSSKTDLGNSLVTADLSEEGV